MQQAMQQAHKGALNQPTIDERIGRGCTVGGFFSALWFTNNSWPSLPVYQLKLTLELLYQLPKCYSPGAKMMEVLIPSGVSTNFAH